MGSKNNEVKQTKHWLFRKINKLGKSIVKVTKRSRDQNS